MQQALALHALYLGLEAEAAPDIHRLLLKAPTNLMPTILHASYLDHEPTLIQICNILRVFGRHPQNAARIVAQKHATVGKAEGTIMDAFAHMLSMASPRLNIAVCQALLPYASAHKLEVCKARLVSHLIALSQSPNPALADAASAILTALA